MPSCSFSQVQDKWNWGQSISAKQVSIMIQVLRLYTEMDDVVKE